MTILEYNLTTFDYILDVAIWLTFQAVLPRESLEQLMYLV
jgi:hypothetical protein